MDPNNNDLATLRPYASTITVADSDDDDGVELGDYSTRRNIYRPQTSTICSSQDHRHSHCQIGHFADGIGGISPSRFHHLLVDANDQNQNQNEAYEEIKRLIVFAGVFFLFMIIFVLLKFQVSLDDVFKWSPVVWLIGVVFCGLVMNLFLHIRRFLQKRMAKRMRQRQELLYSLRLPDSFPCLALPTQDDNNNNNSIDAHHVRCCHNCHRQRIAIVDRASSEWATLSSSGLLPSYDQVQKGASRSWLLSAPAFFATSSRPPTYSPILACQLSEQRVEPSTDNQSIEMTTNQSEDPPPPCYDPDDESIGERQSNCIADVSARELHIETQSSDTNCLPSTTANN